MRIRSSLLWPFCTAEALAARSRSTTHIGPHQQCPSAAPRVLLTAPQQCRRFSSQSTMSDSNTLSNATLKQLSAFWFKGIDSDDIGDDGLPKDAKKRWYFGGKEVDDYCTANYERAVNQAISLASRGGEENDIQPLTSLVHDPDDAVALVMLLDQMPRNIWRGKEAAKAHKDADPIARAITKHYMGDFKGKERQIWSHLTKMQFFYLPLLHSEDVGDHKIIQERIEDILAQTDLTEVERKIMTTFQKFEANHYKVIERFGRYPSRNDCLGRESTQEEKDFIKDGPGW